ncbi:MAG: type VI secretion system protein TssA [Acidobacteriota bacterium]|nr:type VI secretion system protein TssA [Acidobacteriota bacterium]
MSSVVANTSSPISAPAEVINVEALLAPISGEKPAGENLQYQGLHDEMREARRAEDTLEQGDWKRDSKVADWHQVETLTTEALANRTKDLQVCAWLGEALVKLYGFVGLRDGLRVMRGLHERFWESVYPEIDGDDLEARANTLSWMDQQMAEALREVPLTKSAGGTSYTLHHWNDAKQFMIPENVDSLEYEEKQRVAALRTHAAEEGKVTGEDWRNAKNATPRAFYEDVSALVNQSWDEFEALNRVVDEKFGDNPPGLNALKQTLDDLRTLLGQIVKEKRMLEPDPNSPDRAGGASSAAAKNGGATDGAGGSSNSAAAGRASLGASGPVRTRQEALLRLAEVADYFHQTEPHSPVSYLVQRAIQWGNMPLEKWLEDVIKDSGVLDNLRETLGINNTNNSGK